MVGEDHRQETKMPYRESLSMEFIKIKGTGKRRKNREGRQKEKERKEKKEIERGR